MSEVSGKTRDCLDSIGVDLVGEVVPLRDHAGPHFCLRCTMPIAIYGRLSPCNHLYCHTCAKTVKTCTFCHKNVVRVQLLENVDMFVCPYVARGVSEEGGVAGANYRGVARVEPWDGLEACLPVGGGWGWANMSVVSCSLYLSGRILCATRRSLNASSCVWPHPPREYTQAYTVGLSHTARTHDVTRRGAHVLPTATRNLLLLDARAFTDSSAMCHRCGDIISHCIRRC